MLPLLIALTFVMLVYAGLWVARKYGAIPAYIGFAWLIPLTTLIYLKWEYNLGFPFSLINVPFVLAVTGISLLLSAICFPLLIHLNRGRLSVPKVIGLSVSALLHGSPFLLYVFTFISVLIWGK